MELIKITETNGTQAVSAKELYDFLGFNKAVWSRWYQKNIIDNDFAIENTDYQTLNIMLNGNPTKDFALSVDFAKRLSMMARTEKGEDARRYFIECEKVAKNPIQNISRLELAKMIVEAEEEKKQLQIANAKLQNRSDIYELCFGSEKYLSGSQVCKVLELGYGNKTLYKNLREKGVFFKSKNEPMQQFANKKWIILKEKWITGKEKVVLTPYFSQSSLPFLGIKLNAIPNNINKIQIQ